MAVALHLSVAGLESQHNTNVQMIKDYDSCPLVRLAGLALVPVTWTSQPPHLYLRYVLSVCEVPVLCIKYHMTSKIFQLPTFTQIVI